MIAPFAESKDRVEIYARDKPLAALLQAGQLRLAEDGGWTVVAPSDIGLRFNNWDRVRAERLPLLLVSAAGCGVTAFMFLLIVTGRLAYRGERDGAHEPFRNLRRSFSLVLRSSSPLSSPSPLNLEPRLERFEVSGL